jgi:hypothetical protein
VFSGVARFAQDAEIAFALAAEPDVGQVVNVEPPSAGLASLALVAGSLQRPDARVPPVRGAEVFVVGQAGEVCVTSSAARIAEGFLDLAEGTLKGLEACAVGAPRLGGREWLLATGKVSVMRQLRQFCANSRLQGLGSAPI